MDAQRRRGVVIGGTNGHGVGELFLLYFGFWPFACLVRCTVFDEKRCYVNESTGHGDLGYRDSGSWKDLYRDRLSFSFLCCFLA